MSNCSWPFKKIFSGESWRITSCLVTFLAWLSFLGCFQIDHLEKETDLLRQSAGANVVYRGVDLPDGIAPSSAHIINSQNEYLIHLLQVLVISVVMTDIFDSMFPNLVYEVLWVLRVNRHAISRLWVSWTNIREVYSVYLHVNVHVSCWSVLVIWNV